VKCYDLSQAKLLNIVCVQRGAKSLCPNTYSNYRSAQPANRCYSLNLFSVFQYVNLRWVKKRKGPIINTTVRHSTVPHCAVLSSLRNKVSFFVSIE
jgi:hypothetical protein